MERRQASRRVARLASAVFAAAALHAASAQVVVREPAMVKTGLTELDQIVSQSALLISSGSYDQLQREPDRLEAGLAALRSGLGDQSTGSRALLDLLTARARVAASGMGEAARTHNVSMLRITESQLAQAVEAITALCPQELRPARAPPAH